MEGDLKKALGQRLRAHRWATGWSQEQLAAAIGRTTESVSNIERGVSLPGLETLERLSRVLEVPLTEFFARDAEPTDAHRAELEARARALLREFSDDDLAVAVGQLEVLSRRKGRSSDT